MSTGRTIVRNVFSNWFGLGYQVLLAIFITPFMVHRLGNTGYGIWILVGSFIGYFGLMDLGVRTSIVKYCAQYDAGKEEKKFNEIVNSTLVFYLAVGLLVFLLCFGSSFFFPELFVKDTAYREEARLILIIMGLNLFLGFPFEVFGGILSGLQRYDLQNMARVIAATVRSAAVIIFLLHGYGLLTLSLIMLFSNIGFNAMETFFVFRVYPNLKLGRQFVKLKALKQALSYSIFSFILFLGSRIAYHTDALVIGAFMSEQYVTYYAIGGNLIEYLRRLINSMVFVFTPAISASEARGNREEVADILMRGAKYAMLIIMPIGLTLMIMGKAFIGIWMGEEYMDPSGTVLMILMFSHFFALSQYSARSALFGLEKHRVPALAEGMTALANLGLSLILVRPYGIYGVALGTTIPLLVLKAVFYPVYTCRAMKLSFWKYTRQVFTVPVLTSIPFGLILYLFSRFLYPTSFPAFLLEVATAGLVFLGIVWAVGLDQEERRTWNRVLGSLMRKLHLSR